MRKILILSFAVMLVSILHVYQSIEVRKMGYIINEENRTLNIMLEENSKLMLSLSRLESPKYLLENLDYKDVIFTGERLNFCSDSILLS